MSVNKNISSSLLIQIPVFVISVITGIIITRILGSEGKGVYTLFQTDLQFFVMFLTLTMNTGITYFTANNKISLENLMGIVLSVLFVGTFILILFLSYLNFSDNNRLIFPDNYESLFYFGYLVISFILTTLNASVAAIFQGRTSFRLINRIALINCLIQLLLFVIIMLYANMNNTVISAKMVFFFTLLILFVNTLMWLYLFFTKIKIRPAFVGLKNPITILFFSYVFSIYIGTIINFMNYRMDLWIVNYYLSEEELGLYALSGNIIQLFITISVVVSSVLLPYLSGKISESQSMIAFSRSSRMNFLFILIGVIIAFLTAEYLIPKVYGEEFNGSVLPLLIILPGVLLSCSTQLFATLIVAKNKNILNIISTSCGLVVTLILDLILIPEYGIVGAAWATTIAYSTTFILTFILCITVLKIPLQNYFFPTLTELKQGIKKIKSYFYNR